MKITEELLKETESVTFECRDAINIAYSATREPGWTWEYQRAVDVAIYTKLAELQLRIKALEDQISQKKP